MPHLALELHRWRRERVVAREGQRGREDAALERHALGALDHAFPVEEVILMPWPRDDALGAVDAEVAVLGQQTFVCCCCHGVLVVGFVGDVWWGI